MPLRDILIVSIVLILVVLTLRRPWIGVMNWTWLSIMNPHRYSWGFAHGAPLAAIAAGVTLVSLLFSKERQSPFQGAPVGWLFVFAVWMTISWLVGFDPENDYWHWDRAIKIYLMSFVALSILHTKYQLMAFAWVTTASISIIAAKGGLFTIITGGEYRVWGPHGSFIGENNAMALATIMCIPMLRFLQLQLEQKWMRHAMTVAILLSIAAALGSQSRGALVTLAAVAVIFWLKSSHKFIIGIAIVLAGLVFLSMMPEHWWDRMDTIQSYEVDASAMGRINAWLVAIEIAKHNLFGVGMTYQYEPYFVTYGVYETIVRAAHSIYFQVLGNHGFIGLFLFLMIWFTTYHSASQLQKESRSVPQARWAGDLGAMIQVSLFAYAVGGAFLSLSYFDLPYNFMILVVLARKWVKNRAWEEEKDQTFWEYAGFAELGRRR